MKNKGWLEELGVDATTENIADGSKLMGALLSGASDICLLSGFGQVLAAIEKGGRLKIVGGGGQLAFQATFSKRPEIKTLKDLEGRTVGTGSIGALLHQLMVTLLEKKGVDPKKVTFVNIGSSADVFRAVVAGTVDAGPALYDVYEQQERYGVHALTDGNFWTELPEYTYQAAYAPDRAIAEKRDGLVRTLAAYGKMYRYISGPNSLDDYIKARQDGVGGDLKLAAEEAASEWRFIQKYQPYATQLVLDQERIDYMQRINMKFEIQKKIVPYAQVTDMSIARDAAKMLG
jgi:ABC-type nitrate/sulfonate/bicarbonate transport system substrate-binding protein